MATIDQGLLTLDASQCHGPYGCSSNVITENPCSAGSIVYVRSATGLELELESRALALHQLETVHMQKVGGVGVEQMLFESVLVVQGKTAAKRLRLFDVNMECSISAAVTHSTMELQPPPFDSSSFSNSFSFHQSRPQTMPSDLLNKGKGSISLELDI